MSRLHDVPEPSIIPAGAGRPHRSTGVVGGFDDDADGTANEQVALDDPLAVGDRVHLAVAEQVARQDRRSLEVAHRAECVGMLVTQIGFIQFDCRSKQALGFPIVFFRIG